MEVVTSESSCSGRESGLANSVVERVFEVEHVILDNYATHKTPAIKRWLIAHPRFVLHFTPTGASWCNLVERLFGELTARKLRRGAHRSVKALNADIRDWLAHCNENPVPTSGPRPPTRSSPTSPDTATQLTPHDTR